MDASGGHHVKGSKPGSDTRRPHDFSHTWKTEPKMNMYTKTSKIIYKLGCRTTLRNLGKEEKEKRMAEHQ
jgi:hypothetical protein